jgi:hypothetical protein
MGVVGSGEPLSGNAIGGIVSTGEEKLIFPIGMGEISSIG